MKESVTKFDLEAAFKALDEIDTPAVNEGIKANKPAFTEIFSRKSKFDSLMEEYYDISDSAGLNDAKDAREAEIAKAKLARIEKIVDLDAKTPEDLLTSYVGKLIIQCPQCMTLFYKNPEDVEESEDDATVVNISEVCQHCGNESGYTLVGKVGEATPEEMDEFDTSELEVDEGEEPSEDDVLTVDVDGTDEEDEDVDSDEEADLDIDLDAIEEDESEEEDKKEESFTVEHENVLVEQLTESSDVETSAEDFEKLINSPEFKKPISDTAVRTMMQEFDETKDESKETTESLKEGCSEQNNEANIEETVEDTEEALTEAGLGTLAKTIGKKAKQLGGKVKNGISNAIDKFAESANTREEKADWILTNARKDYSKIELDDKGEPIADENNRKYKVFLVIGFRDKYSNGKQITMPPSYNNKDLIVGMEKPKAFETYKAADDTAKGWSMRQGNGPAFVYLANALEDEKALFLCQYFKGELKNDQLEKYLDAVKKDIKGASLEANGEAQNVATQDSTNEAPVETKATKASEVQQGMKIQYGDASAEVTEVSNTSSGKAISIKYADGNTDTLNVGNDATMMVIAEALESTIFGLSTFMENLDELQESNLEDFISNSLVESYKNVAGFRLAECNYSDNKFIVSGTIHFTSGKSRKTAYTFTEAVEKDGVVTLHGINEKLGSDKKFVLTGRTEDKTFITEAFKRI